MATNIKDYSAVKQRPVGSKRFTDILLEYNESRVSDYAGGGYFAGLKSLGTVVVGKGGTYLQQGLGFYNNTNIPDYWFASETQNAYTGELQLQGNVIMYVRIEKVSDLGLTEGYYCASHYVASTQANAKTATPPINLATFLAQHGDKYVVTEMQFYDNTNDGVISAANPRTKIGFVFGSKTTGGGVVSDIFARFYAPILHKTTDQIADYDILLPIGAPFMCSNNTGYGASSAWFAWVRTLMTDMTQFARYTSSPPLESNPVSYTPTKQLLMYPSAGAIIAHLNEIGIPFTQDLVQATTGNSSEFPDYIPVGQPEDPTGGGTGTGDNSSDEITESDPDVTAISSFNQHYAMTHGMLSALGDYLWTSTFFSDIKLLFNDPMEAVVSCKMFPFSLPGHDGSHVGGSESILLGNVNTGIPGYPITSGYNCRFDLGSLAIEEYYGSAMDYEPYTMLSLYLPYIGIKDISTNDFMGKTLAVKYIVDITTGACVAEVWADSQLLYTFDGKIGVDVPISSTNAAQYAAGMLMTGIGAIGGLAASGGNPLAVAGTVLATAKGVAGNQFHVNKGGVNSPMSGFYTPQYPYLIINRPIQSLPSNFGTIKGYPSNVTRVLSTLTGFTQVDEVQLDNITNGTTYATTDEISEIYNLLKEGVIL